MNSIAIPEFVSSTMPQIKTWLETKALPIMHAFEAGPTGRSGFYATSHRVASIQFDECKLSWVTLDTIRTTSATTIVSWHRLAPVGQLDTGSIAVAQPGATIGDKTLPVVRMAPKGSAASAQIQRWKDGGASEAETQALIYVDNAADGFRLAAAIKRAAILCGAVSARF